MGEEAPGRPREPSPFSNKNLTNGESPVIDPRASFASPALEDAEASILKNGTQVLLLAATQTERDAVLERLRPLVDQECVLRVFSGAQTYYVGRLGSAHVVLTTCRAGSSSRDGATLVTHEAIGRARPRAVVAVGMAFGGYTDKLKIGDVMVSTHLIPYEPSRKQDTGDIPRGGEHDAGALLLNRFLESRSWTYPRADGYACQVRDGRLLSGEKLVDSLEFKTELFTAHPEAIGGEMEGSGVRAAAERCGISEWIIVKAVCDWGDGTKNKEHQPLAATIAVALVEHVFTPKGVLDDLPPFNGADDEKQAQTSGTSVVSNIGTQNIVHGTQNIVHGNQTIVTAPSADVDELLDAINTLLNHGLIAEADARLHYSDARMWSRMDNAQKARLRALRGKRKTLLGDKDGAARDFLEAHDLNPADEKAVSRKCQALLFLGQTAEAYAAAQTALATFPNHPYARPFLIASAPAAISIDELLPPSWRGSQVTSEEAVAAFRRVYSTDSALAEEILRRVHEPKSEDVDYWTALAAAIDQQILEGERRGDSTPDSRRSELLAALRVAYESIRSPASEEQRGRIAFAIAVQSKRLGRVDDYKRWFTTAKELIPDDIHVITERAHEAGDRGDFKTASDLLRGVISSPDRPDLARVVFANALLKLGTTEARQEAYGALEEAASDTEDPPRDRRFSAMRLVEAQMDFDLSAAAASIERHQEALGAYGAERLRLVLGHESGNNDEAKKIATRMMASTSRYAPDDLVDLGCLLGALRLNNECVAVLEALAPRTELGRPTIALINAAMATGRLELVANICKALRTAGVEDHQIVDGEAYILSLRGDLSGALELVQAWMAKHPHDKRIRLRLSGIAHELGRKDLLPTRADQLPEPTDAHPDIAPDVVRILRAANEHAEARRFAYANLKRRRRDEWAWQAVSIAGLPAAVFGHTDDLTESAPTPTLLAGPGIAVRIKERDSSRWIYLEESDELATAEDEYGPTHPMTIALMGKKVGDRVELQKGQFGFPARTAEIDALTSCFTKACQECNDSYELQFPDAPFIHSFHVPDSVDDLIAILLAGAKERHESVEQVVKAYEEKPTISLHGLAALCHRPVFEVIPLLVSNNSVIHAARPPERMKRGRESLLRTREVVIEATAISTLAMLETLDRARPYFSKIWIARATLDRLRTYIHRAIFDGSSGHMGLEGGQLFYSKRDPAFDARRADYLRNLLAAVESWDVFQEDEREMLVSTAWDNWTKIAGGGTADSVHRAKRLGLALWTDDFAVAAAAEHEGATPISTQAVFEALAALNVVTRNELADVGAKLVGWRYVDTRTPPESFLAATKIAKWDASARPLVQHMELFTTANWSETGLALVAAEVFRLWWNNTLDRKAVDALIVAALMRLAARSNGERVLKLLLAAVQGRFGLDVIGAGHVSEAIVGWMGTRAG